MSDEVEEFDFEKYKLGELIEVLVNRSTWTEAMLVRIDEDDPSLPWGVTFEVPPHHETMSADDIEDWREDQGWHWKSDAEVRPCHYVDKNFVIQEDTLLEMSW